jgi:hypothetical protein
MSHRNESILRGSDFDDIGQTKKSGTVLIWGGRIREVFVLRENFEIKDVRVTSVFFAESFQDELVLHLTNSQVTQTFLDLVLSFSCDRVTRMFY